MKSFFQFFVEKNVLGLEELIYVDGVGELSAKLDTGNGAFNVLHGIDIQIKNNRVSFTTVHDKKITKSISDTITINLGAGNTEERPVVLFDVELGNNVFKNIPFSISNRSDNNHKVLIGKTFIEKNLDALIDVGLKNVANKYLEADYD
jgi:hypothetical protein